MMKEIPGFPDYKINENGIVLNKHGHVMRPALSNMGRPRVSLIKYNKNGKKFKFNMGISRLVAMTFLENPKNLPIVMHLDNDVLNNHVSNLKWGNQSENSLQAFKEGRRISPNKGNHNNYLYKVYNNSDIKYCNGCEGVANLLGFTCKNSIRPGIVKSGQFKNYKIENTHIKIKDAFKPLD